MQPASSRTSRSKRGTGTEQERERPRGDRSAIALPRRHGADSARACPLRVIIRLCVSSVPTATGSRRFTVPGSVRGWRTDALRRSGRTGARSRPVHRIQRTWKTYDQHRQRRGRCDGRGGLVDERQRGDERRARGTAASPAAHRRPPAGAARYCFERNWTGCSHGRRSSAARQRRPGAMRERERQWRRTGARALRRGRKPLQRR